MSDTTLVTEASTTTDAAAPPAGDTLATAPAEATPATQQPSATTTEAAAEVKAEGGDAPKTEVKTEALKAPEKYEFKSPEGVSMDPSVLGEFEALARELDLPQEAAQKVIDKLAPKLAQATVDAQVANLKKAGETWMSEVNKASDIGGEHLPETKVSVAKAMDTFATKELRTLLDQTRLGNHPEFVRLLAKVGKAISEDKVITGNKPAGPPQKSALDVLYPTMTKQGA